MSSQYEYFNQIGQYKNMKHTSIQLRENLNKISLWLYSNLSTNIPLYERLLNDQMFSVSNGTVGNVHIDIIANNSISIYIKPLQGNFTLNNVNLLYIRDPSLVDTHKLEGGYCSVDSLYESMLLKDDSKSYDTICNYSWVISQSREYKLNVLLEESRVTLGVE